MEKKTIYRDTDISTWLVYLTKDSDPIVYEGRYDAVCKDVSQLSDYSNETVIKKATYKNLVRQNVNIDEIWIAKHEVCPNGVFGVEWSSDIGFGRYVLILGDDGKLHAQTEHMDNGEDKSFTKDILHALVEHIVIEN